MHKLFGKPWFKVVAVLVVLAVIYIWTNGGGRSLTSLKSIGSSKSAGSPSYAPTMGNFPSEFADFSGSAGGASEQRMLGTSMPPIYDSGGTTSKVDAKIIQSGSLNLEVESVPKTIDEITSVADRRGGFVISSNFYESPTGAKSGSAQVKVPFKEFSAALSDLKGLAKFVEQESVNSQDVTEEYTDLQSQLRNLKAEETAYLEVMQKAVKIEDILSVSQRLYDVRGRIEQTQGRISYYDNRTDYSVISVQMTEESIVKAPANKWRPGEEVRSGAKRLIVSLQGFVSNIIAFAFWLVGILPYLLILAVIIFVVRTIHHRRQRAASSASATSSTPH